MILLTGATGFVGKRVLKELLDQGESVICLARTPQKFEEHQNLTVIKCDLESSEVAYLHEDHQELLDVTRVIHLAALYDLAASAGACYMANVVATMNLLSLVRHLPKFEMFYDISTVAVAGDYKGVFPTDDVEFKQKFPNYYAKTKAKAESLLRKGLPSHKLCILRPGIIIGDSKDGVFDKIDGPYMALQFFKQLFERLPMLKNLPIFPLPMNAKAMLPLVFVDQVVDSIIHAVKSPKLSGCYHLVTKDAPTVLEFASDLFKALGANGRIIATKGAKPLAALVKHLPPIPDFPAPLMDYMATEVSYDIARESEIFPALKNITWIEYKSQFFRQALIKI